MKTTIDIADGLLAEVELLASQQETTVRALVEEGLRHVLEKRNRSEGFALRPVTFRGNGVRPEVREGSWERVQNLTYESRGA